MRNGSVSSIDRAPPRKGSLMHLKLDDERAALKDAVRAFAKEQVRPKAREWEEEQRIDARTLDQAWQLGFAAMGVGPSFGGAGDRINCITKKSVAPYPESMAMAYVSPP